MNTVNPNTQSYQCLHNSPLGCPKNQETVDTIPGAKFCLDCGFPTPLPLQAEIRSSFGTYQISERLPSRGLGRLYRAQQLEKGQSVIVQEYLLPSRCFNASEIQQRKAVFLQATQIGIDHSKGKDFRVIRPVDRFVDEIRDRLYLVFPGMLAASPSLSDILNEKGAFAPDQVRQILNQVLQTLHFLHCQSTHSSGSIVAESGVHGNIRLESLLLGDNFYVYTTDPKQWNDWVSPVPLERTLPQQDLQDLGHVGFSLWSGQVCEHFSDLKVRESKSWPQDDPELKQYLSQLLGLEMPFASAESARLALLNLPPAKSTNAYLERPNPPQAKKKARPYWLFSLLVLPLIGGLLWLFLPRSMQNSYAEETQFESLLPSFEDINGLEPGQYPYTGERVGTWSTVLDKRPVSDRKIRELLSQPKADVSALFDYRGYRPTRSPLEEVLTQNDKANFAIAADANPLPEGLLQETIAYDGLLVYVPAYKRHSLPRALQGKISLVQLKQIFTGELTHWQQLGPDFPDLPIKAYRPKDPEALRFFQTHVIGNDPERIAQFNKIKTRATFNTLRSIAAGEKRDQETEAGTISFGLLTQTWDQCKVFPLSLSTKDSPAVQPLLRETIKGKLQPISYRDNLCREKKPLPNLAAFQRKTYPLSLPLMIAYPRDNDLPGHQSGPLFAKFLKTQDGQYLLQQTGLVPLQQTPKSHLISSSILNR